MDFRLITPQETVYSTEADLVGGRTSEGSFSILPRHIPAIMELEPAVLKVQSDGDTKEFVVQGGFLFKERDDTLKILTPEAKSVDEVDPEETKSRIQELTKSLEKGDESSPLVDYIQTKLERARTELSVVENE